jgi:glycosyltransferase involved in cell wall biosynthesis
MSIAALARPVNRAPVLDITIPVFNEERVLASAVRRLHAHVNGDFPYSTRITIADNASTDGTAAQALKLAVELPDIRLVRLNRKGKGRAVAASWMTSDAHVVAYMDADLSTDLSALLPLVAPIISGHCDVSIGSRIASGARFVRSPRRNPRREVLSRSYDLLLHLALGIRVKDAQCGFKAMRADVARRLVPAVQSRGWFFDTELLVRAERAGLRVHELMVDWSWTPTSRDHLIESVSARPRPA